MHNDSAPNGAHTKNIVLKKILSGEVSMRPKLYFTLKTIALAATVILTTIVSSLLVSFIIFAVKVSGHIFLFGFGGRGFFMFLSLFPWTLLVIEVLLLLILDALLKHFKFGYRYPLLYILSAIGVVSICCGVGINQTNLHPTLLEHANEGRLPVFGGLYEHAFHPPQDHGRGIYRGTITVINDGTFTLFHDDVDSDSDDGLEQVIVPPPLQPQFHDLFQVNDQVFVAGKRTETGALEAYGIRKLNDDPTEVHIEIKQPAPSY
ncbi:MAG TPA: hypothetical protein VG982_01325 [Candidatus Paceibacterota bacterium]|jgi:hypothetical protein|nr:hypothetical protein [Candidatus Paceibacterota bacterium]